MSARWAFQSSLKFSVSYPHSRVRKSMSMFLGLDDICKEQVLAHDKKSRFSRALWAVSEAERRTGAFARATRFTRATLAAVGDVSSLPASSPTAVARRKKKMRDEKACTLAGGSKNQSVASSRRHLLLFTDANKIFRAAAKQALAAHPRAARGSGDGLDVRGGRSDSEDGRRAPRISRGRPGWRERSVPGARRSWHRRRACFRRDRAPPRA